MLLGVSSLLPHVGQSMATSQLLVHWVEMPRGSSNVLLKKSLCLPYRGLCTWHSSSAPTLLWQAWRLTCGSPRHPCHCHGEAWDKNLVGGDGANLIMDGIAMGLGRPVLGRAEMGVESDRRQQEHYASCMVAMA
jgi:hypothetical protein